MLMNTSISGKSLHILLMFCVAIQYFNSPYAVRSGTFHGSGRWKKENTRSARDQNKDVPHEDGIIESADLSVQHTCFTAQMHCIGVPFSRTSGYKLNVAEIILTPMRGVCHAGAGRTQRKYLLSISRAAINAALSHRWIPESSANLTSNVQRYYYTMPAIIISIILLMETWADFWLKCQRHENQTSPWPPWIWINEIFRLQFSFPTAPRAMWLS